MRSDEERLGLRFRKHATIRFTLRRRSILAITRSVLYLLLLLLIHGRYADAIQLVDSCSTDSDVSAEEAQLGVTLTAAPSR